MAGSVNKKTAWHSGWEASQDCCCPTIIACLACICTALLHAVRLCPEWVSRLLSAQVQTGDGQMHADCNTVNMTLELHWSQG